VVPSPCIGICQLNDSGICIGCHRTPEQIKKNGIDYYESMQRYIQSNSKKNIQQYDNED
jgi:predicted Fe-S protein YdhL (DUF1289 family)